MRRYIDSGSSLTALAVRGVRQSLNDPIAPVFILKNGTPAPPLHVDLASIASESDARAAAYGYASAVLGKRSRLNGFTALEHCATVAICKAAGTETD
jgi:hypothetical protein